MKHRATEQQRFGIVCFVILVVVAVALGHKALADVDLGWHLAGGLWMLDHHAVPRMDPLAAPSAMWVDYSWLFQILIAQIFTWGGFVALQLFQTFLIVVSILVFWSLVRKSLIDFAPHAGSICSLIAVLSSLLFVAPVWHLRPQLLSVIFFCMLLRLILERPLSLWLIVLTIVWANVHIYWPLVPAIILLNGFLHASGNRDFLVKSVCLTVATLFAGLLNPYGLENLRCIWQYLSEHSVAYQLIREFQPLGPEHGLAFWLFMISVGLIAIFSRVILTRAQILSVALLPITALLAFSQIKYLPLYGVVIALVFGRAILPRLLEGTRLFSFQSNSSSPVVWMLALILGVVFVFVASDGVISQPQLSQRHEEIFKAVTALVDQAPTTSVVLNHFDDGGWIELATLLEAKRRGIELPVKAMYDGRTLVMGEERLRDFNKLQFLKDGWCDVVKRSGATAAILPANIPLSKALLDNECHDPGWKILLQGENIQTLIH